MLSHLRSSNLERLVPTPVDMHPRVNTAVSIIELSSKLTLSHMCRSLEQRAGAGWENPVPIPNVCPANTKVMGTNPTSIAIFAVA